MMWKFNYMQGAIIRVLTYQRYNANITVWYFFVFSHVPPDAGTRNSYYLRTFCWHHMTLRLTKPNVFNTVI